MNEYSSKDLFKISNELRKDILDISYLAKAHHIGSEFSCIDILTSIFFNYMDTDINNYMDVNSDTFCLSKGHAALALYVTLSKKGFFSKEKLIENFLTDGGNLGGHPDRYSLPGIEINSGSLGHSLSVGAGIALAAKNDSINKKIIVLLGDGECNEGMIWEAALFSSHYNLNNLIAIIDLNGLQGLGTTNQVMNLNSLNNKFESFGWFTQEIDGHNFDQINYSIKQCGIKNKMPNIIIANTIKGKGVTSMENTLKSHYETLTKERYNETLDELRQFTNNEF